MNRTKLVSVLVQQAYQKVTDTDTLLKIQATNVQESMTIDNTMTHCIPRKINKSYKLKMDQLTKDRLKTSRLLDN